MPIDFAPSVIKYVLADGLFVAFCKESVLPTGEPAHAEFWDHASGGWDAAFDQAKHLRPLARMAPIGSLNANFQSFAAPYAAANKAGVHALVYRRTAAGPLVEYGRVDGPSLARLTNAD
jgi:hypothetical protein